ncbi:MAG: hypothetical protein ABIH49_01155 [archaeon]
MESIKILSKRENTEIEKKLNEQFGIKKIPDVISATGKEKLFLFSGNYNEEQIKKLESIVPVEKVGIYFAKKEERDGSIRLSIEGTQILKKQINKNIFSLNSEQTEDWMKGHELNVKTGMKGFVVMKHNDDFLGCGKASEEKITNFIPKSRRLKEKS